MQIKTIYINLMKTTRFTMSCANIIEVCTMQKRPQVATNRCLTKLNYITSTWNGVNKNHLMILLRKLTQFEKKYIYDRNLVSHGLHLAMEENQNALMNQMKLDVDSQIYFYLVFSVE